MHNVSLRDKLRIQTLREQKRGANVIVVDCCVWGAMLEAQHKLKQEDQLSQRDHAVLRVIEYFAKSLKITEGHST